MVFTLKLAAQAQVAVIAGFKARKLRQITSMFLYCKAFHVASQ